MEAAIAIDEKVYGRNHPELATDLNNLAGLLESQVRSSLRGGARASHSPF